MLHSVSPYATQAYVSSKQKHYGIKNKEYIWILWNVLELKKIIMKY